MPVNLKRLSEITASVTSPSSSDQLVGVQSGNDVLFYVKDVGGRQLLRANVEYYVSNLGNDSNDGSIGSPWATIQHAANFINTELDLNSFQIIVHIAAGSYVGLDMPSFTGGGVIYFRGAGSASTTINNSPSGSAPWNIPNGGTNTVVGFNKIKFVSSGNPCINNYATPINLRTGDPRSFIPVVSLDDDDVVFSPSSNQWALTTGGCGGCVNNIGGSKNSGTHTYIPPANPFGWFFCEFDTPVILTGHFVTTGNPFWADAAVRPNTRATIVNNAATFTGAATGWRWDNNFSSAICDNDAGVEWLPGNTLAGSDATSTYGSFAPNIGIFEWNTGVNPSGNLGASAYNYISVNYSTSNNFVVTSAANCAMPFPTGSGLQFPFGPGYEARILQKGTGAVTIVPDTGVTVHNAGVIPGGQWGEVRLRQLALDEWVMITA